jgi:hypothetical protein
MKDIDVNVYGEIVSMQSYPNSYEEYDSMATTSAFERARSRDTAAWRAKVLKAAASIVEAESGIKQKTTKRNGKDVVSESPSSFFDRITATEDEDGNEVESLVSMDVVRNACNKVAEELKLVSVLTPERSSGGSSIPTCAEGTRTLLQSIIDSGEFDDRIKVLKARIESTATFAENLGKHFEVPAKVMEIVEGADYEDDGYLDAYVYAANLCKNFQDAATGTRVTRRKAS